MSATLSQPSGSYPRRSTGRSSASNPHGSWRKALWRFLVQLGHARAVPHMRALAAQHEHSNPELARALREAVRGPLE